MTTGTSSNLRKAHQLQITVNVLTSMEKITFSLNSRKQKSRLSYCAPCVLLPSKHAEIDKHVHAYTDQLRH